MEADTTEQIDPALVNLLLTQPELIANNPEIMHFGLNGGVINQENCPQIKELSNDDLKDIGLLPDDEEDVDNDTTDDDVNVIDRDVDEDENNDLGEHINNNVNSTISEVKPSISNDSIELPKTRTRLLKNNKIDSGLPNITIGNHLTGKKTSYVSQFTNQIPTINKNNMQAQYNHYIANQSIANQSMSNQQTDEYQIASQKPNISTHESNPQQTAMPNFSQEIPEYSQNPYFYNQQYMPSIANIGIQGYQQKNPFANDNKNLGNNGGVVNNDNDHNNQNNGSNSTMNNVNTINSNNLVLPKKRELNVQHTRNFDNNSDGRSYHSQQNLLSVLTWNIWFEARHQKERTLRIIQTIKQIEPDLVCLQEVTPASYNLIKGRLLDYQTFEIFIEEGYSYGVCILCKKETIEVIDPYYYDYQNTQMGRRLVGCEVKLLKYGRKMHILTTHLESMWENKDVRNLQFETIKEVIKDINDDILIAGDFNICSEKEPIEKNIATTNLVDTWVELGCPTSIKYTYDSVNNKNIQNSNMRSRLDRIYYNCSNNKNTNFRNSKYHVHGLKLIGLNSTSPDILEPPSDHFGLLAEFVFGH